jgi:AcrR family transcriptional regulator
VQAVVVDDPDEVSHRPAYRRSAGSARGNARRLELLEAVTDDLAANGLADFSLRRAARAADATHKVLLYHFQSADDLLVQAVVKLRERRIGRGLAAASEEPGSSLSARVRALWPVLSSEDAAVLDQAIGLAMYDPHRYSDLGRGASEQYLPSLLSICPPEWSDRRKVEVAQMVLAVLRGFLVHARTSGDAAAIAAGFDALVRALEREESAGE